MLQEGHEAATQGVVPEEDQTTPQGMMRAVSPSLRIRAAHDTPLAGSKQVSCRACSFAAHVIHANQLKPSLSGVAAWFQLVFFEVAMAWTLLGLCN